MGRSLATTTEPGTLSRFESDYRRRYPQRTREPARRPKPPARRQAERELAHRLEKLPPEVGALLMVVGVFGILLPGPVGSPFLVAGGLALWPSGFQWFEDALRRMSPKLYAEGISQLERYLADLERRYPGTTR